MEGENTIPPQEKKDVSQAEFAEYLIGAIKAVENTDVKGESEPPIVETPAIETIPPVEIPAPKGEIEPKPTEKKPSQSSRFSGMVNFSGEKGRIVTEIIEKGIEEGYWKTKQQFYDKVFDFAINSQLVHAHLNVTDAYIFGVPDTVQTKLFTNGYYENDSQLKLEKC